MQETYKDVCVCNEVCFSTMDYVCFVSMYDIGICLCCRSCDIPLLISRRKKMQEGPRTCVCVDEVYFFESGLFMSCVACMIDVYGVLLNLR